MTGKVGMQRNPNSLANLEAHKWKPGESGNEDGYSVTRRARDKMVKEVCPFDGQGRQWGEVLPEALLRQALNKVEGMRHLLDRIEGPVTETPPVTVDNRQYNFIVQDNAVKDRLQQLMSGKPKELSSGNPSS